MSVFENSTKMLDVILSFAAKDGSFRKSNSREFISDGKDYLLMMIARDNHNGVVYVTVQVVRAMSYFVVCEYNSAYEYKDFGKGFVLVANGREPSNFKLNRGSIEEAEHLLMIGLLSK